MTHVFNSVQIDDFVKGDGIDHRVAVRATSTADVNLASNLVGAIIDGVTLVANDRILLKNQSSPIQNGIYTVIAGAGNSLRAEDLAVGEAASWVFVQVQEGTIGAKSSWICTSAPGADVVGTNNLTWIQQSLYNYTTGSFFYANSSGTLTTLNAPSSTSILQITSGGVPSWVDKDTVLAGLDPKESVRFGTTDLINGGYLPTGGTGLTGAFVNVDFTDASAFDLNANPVVVGDRILVKNQIDQPEITNITTPAGSAFTAGGTGNYVSMYSAQNGAQYVFWFNVSGGNSAPVVPGATLVPVAITAASTNTAVASALSAVVNAEAAFNTSLLSATVTVTNANNGAATDTSITNMPVGTSKSIISEGGRATENGIYVVTTAGSNGGMERAPDQDGDPANEVSGGNFTFIELGSTLAQTGWVLQGDGILTLNTDDMDWVQFNAATSITAGDGIDILANVVSADLKVNGGLVFETGEIAVDLSASNITGTLAVGDGGTGRTSITSGSLIVGAGSSPATEFAPVSRKVMITTSSPAFALSNTVNLAQINGAADDLALVTFTAAGSAVNFFNVANASTGNTPKITATGTDTNVNFDLQAKGTGTYRFNATSDAAAEIRLFEDTDNGTSYVGLRAGSIPSSLTFTLPTADGSSGHLMRTDGSGNLSFINPDATLKQELANLAIRSTASSTTYTAVMYISWSNSRNGSATTRTVFYEVEYADRALDIQLYNTTAATSLGSDTGVATSGFRSFTFTNPGANARLEVQIRKTSGGGTSPIVYGIQVSLN